MSLKRYSRQIAYWGETNQKKISNTTVFIAGVGGLGSVLSEILVRAGIGKLVLCDNGITDEPDLNRQTLYTLDDIGKKKVLTAKKQLNKINPSVKIEILDKKIDNESNFDFTDIEIVADCLDNFESRFILYNKIPDLYYIHGGVDAYTGQVISLKKGISKSINELFAGLEDKNEMIPVTPDTVQIISSVMAREIFNIAMGRKPILLNKFWIINFEDLFVDFMEI